MKVNETQHGQVTGSEGKARTRPSEQGHFQKIMDQAVQKGQAGGEVQSASGVPVPHGVQIIPGLDRVQAVHSEGARDRLLSDLRETLDMVDHYAAVLGDSSLSSQEMRPLVEHLEGRVQGLREMESDPALPDKLRSVVSDLVITIGTEAAKFGRGDYE